MNIAVFGKPGSGKSTLCNNLAEHLQLVILAAGDYLNELRQEDSILGRYVRNNYSLVGLREIGLEYCENSTFGSMKFIIFY